MARRVFKVDVERDNAPGGSKARAIEMTISGLLLVDIRSAEVGSYPFLELTHPEGVPLAVCARDDAQVRRMSRYGDTRVIEGAAQPYCTGVCDPGGVNFPSNLTFYNFWIAVRIVFTKHIKCRQLHPLTLPWWRTFARYR